MMNEYSLLLSWAVINPLGFWGGLILPFLLAVIAFSFSIKSNQKIKYFVPLLIFGFLVELINLAVYQSWLWPTGLSSDGNLPGGNLLVIVILLPYLANEIRDKFHPLDALWMTWLILFTIDVITAALQAGDASKYMGIGASGFKDGLFIFPLLAAIASLLLKMTIRNGIKLPRIT